MPSLRPALTLLMAFTLLLGGIYPAVVTLIADIAFPRAAHGSLIEKDGHIIGSALLAQPFASTKYFWPRPSATTPPYNGAASGASNLSPGNPALAEAVKERVEALQKADPSNTHPIPAELVEASGSGLDPDISPQAADWQAPRVAKARGLDTEEVRALIRLQTQGREWGLFGMPRVNVLRLNMALDMLPRK